jgi:hypothetical protein
VRCILWLLVSYLVRPWPSWAQAKQVKISEGFYILGVGDQERSYFGVIRLVSSSIDYEPPSRGLSRSGDHGQVCSALSPRDRTPNTNKSTGTGDDAYLLTYLLLISNKLTVPRLAGFSLPLSQNTF